MIGINLPLDMPKLLHILAGTKIKEEQVKRFILFALSVGLAVSIFFCTKDNNETQEAAAGKNKFATIQQKIIEPFYYVALQHTGPYEDHQKVITEFIGLFQQLKQEPAGPMMGIYYNDPSQVPAEKLQWAVAFPVKDSLTVPQPLVCGKWMNREIVSYLYIGPYEESGQAYQLMDEYLVKKGLVQNGPVIERFLDVDPSKVAPESLRTEIWFAVEKKSGE